MELKEFKIRASGCGSIMGIKGLGKTGESFLKQWLKEQLYNRRKEFSNKYTQKGNICEDNSIDFVADYLNLGFLIKNEKHFENEYVQGTPDVILKDLIIDVKNSWDIFTFPLFETEVPNSDYYWQAQIYMELLNIDNYKLCYILSDTPINIIESEAKRHCYTNGLSLEDDYEEILCEFESKMTYSDVDSALKLRVFDIKRDKEDYNLIVERVKLSREYIKKQIELLNQNT